MITISTKEIKRFKSAADLIPENHLLPVYSYIKLVVDKDRSYFVKHSGERFLVFDVDATCDKPQTLMIETKPFFGFIGCTKSDFISISLSGKKIKIDDGQEPVSFQTTNDLFPTIHEKDGDKSIEISEEARAAIVTARSHARSSSEINPTDWMCYIHMKKMNEKFYVVSTKTELTYFNGFEEELPEISISQSVVSVLSSGSNFTYSSAKNYDYFETIGVLYGFLKAEIRCPKEVEYVLKNMKSESYFEVERQPIVDFCNLVLAINNSSVVPQIKFSSSGDQVIASFKDTMDNINTERKIPIENKTFDFTEIPFQPKNILTVLNGIDSERVKVSYGHRNFIITNNEPNYMGAVMEYGIVVKPNPNK